jgi:hypothetical protein
MFTRVTACQLAERVRSLLGGTDPATVREAALALNVAETEMWEIIRYETRYPSVGVLAALVALYGVDAGWLLTGTYSPATHRASEEAAEAPRSAVARLMR